MEIISAAFLVASVIASSLPNLSIAERHSSFSKVALDVESLLTFKKSVSRDPFHVLHNWNNSLSHCNWTGISCSSRHPGRVVSLNLFNSSLQGTLSPHIGNLSFLYYLDISYNAFGGDIPPTIGDLRKLRVLDLSSNFLHGILPPQLGRLKNLQILYAHHNALTGSIPSTLPNCTKLAVIRLSDNKLSGNIPKYIGSLTQLFFLHLGNNYLTGNIEDSIQNLTSLQTLSLNDNQFGGTLPSWIGKLSKLENLYLSDNHLKGSVPESLSNATRLTNISLSGNAFGGMLPSGIGKLSNLEHLYLADNSFKGIIPQSLSNATRLRTLELTINDFAGIVPSWIGKLSKLEVLNLHNNHFKGSIPETLSNATGLTTIELSRNDFEGTIPLSFGRLSSLEWFAAFDNNIESGITSSYQPIPILVALSNCSKLNTLNLGINKLGGTLPSVLPTHLEKLYLYQNQISGNIPPSIGNLSRLAILSLHGNNLKGFIPPTIAFLKSLQGLDLSHNFLEGNIPKEIASLTISLEYVYLNYNSLTGSISKSIGDLSNLRSLQLSNNLFSGGIPHELGNCVFLEDLLLSFNHLSGEIPREVANLKHIQFTLDLSNNNLSGNVPPEIRGLQMALNIVLSNNHLSGQVGLYMVDWLNAQYINMSFNKFSGSLPDNFGAKQIGLKQIDISYNNFSGAVPSSLYDHSSIELLNFSYNNFKGTISCTGAFKKFNHSSFLHNHLLCGKCMSLPACKDVSAEHTYSHLYKTKWFIVIIVIVGLSCMVPLCYLLFFQKKKQDSLKMDEHLTSQFRAVSKEELVTATNYFSEANIIGKGSYGAVYSGVLQSREMIAVKIFNRENHERSNASFIRECQTLGKVRHRNLTKIITVCCEDNFRAIVFPLMTKGNLHDLLYERDMEGLLTPISLEMRMDIISELAGALSYLHHDCIPSIVHCDVKPENVLLDNDMTVKLTDFGIAKIVGANPDSTTLSLKGSVGYIAPEYGMGGDATSKGDVYSFGVVILEIMTRKKPTDDMFNNSMSILRWVSMALGEEVNNREKLKSILEFANHSEEDFKRMEGMIKLGIVCCNEDPLQRPTMREVENILSMFVGFDAGQTRVMPSLDDIEVSLHAYQAQPPRESTFSSIF